MSTSRLALPFKGATLRRHRETNGLTLKDLSERTAALGMRVSPPTISRYEAGEFAPSAPRLHVLATALELGVEELCKDIPEAPHGSAS